MQKQYLSALTRGMPANYHTKPQKKSKMKSSTISPHQAVSNINKSGKIQVAFDAGARQENTSLNDQVCKGSELLHHIVGTLPCFRQGKHSVMADIKKMFHQVMVQEKDRDTLIFLWHLSKDEEFQELRMNFHLFGKVTQPCCCIWALNKTSTSNISNITT